MLKLYLAVITLGLIAQINCQNVPAFIFGDKPYYPNEKYCENGKDIKADGKGISIFLPTLQHISGDEFVTLVKSQADKDTLTVVFVENELSVEDLSQCKLNTRTCFENLRKTEKTYLSSVSEPVDSLISAFGEKNRKSISVNSDDDLSEVSLDGEKILFVYLDDVDRPEDFSKHDELIAKLLQQLQSKNGEVVAIYTGIHPSFKYSQPLKRQVRSAEPEEKVVPAEEKVVPAEKAASAEKTAPAPSTAKSVQIPKARADGDKEQPKVFQDRHVLMALRNISIQLRVAESQEVFVNPNDFTLSVANQSETGMIVTIQTTGHVLTFTISISAGTWKIHFNYNNNVDTQEQFHPRSPIRGFGETWSFGCGDLYLESFRRTIKLTDFQIQPFFTASESLPVAFSDNVNDCVGFFSPGIWGALFIIILFLSIMAYGLTMMMDIKTMDKFDDPKGKTITINAQE